MHELPSWHKQKKYIGFSSFCIVAMLLPFLSAPDCLWNSTWFFSLVSNIGCRCNRSYLHPLTYIYLPTHMNFIPLHIPSNQQPSGIIYISLNDSTANHKNRYLSVPVLFLNILLTTGSLFSVAIQNFDLMVQVFVIHVALAPNLVQNTTLYCFTFK